MVSKERYYCRKVSSCVIRVGKAKVSGRWCNSRAGGKEGKTRGVIAQAGQEEEEDEGFLFFSHKVFV